MTIYPVVLSGGSGTRLWPASRPERPKQFLPLTGDRSSFQETLLRLAGVPDSARPVVVTGAAWADIVLEQGKAVGIHPLVLVEPEGRDSGPAVAAAAAFIEGLDPSGVVLMLAADHYIAEPEIFAQAAVQAAKAASRGYIVTFGVKPSEPSTAYGYIRPGVSLGEGLRKVEAFVEKPDHATALKYLSQGYLWNSGNFAFPAGVLMDEMTAFAPDLADAAVNAVRGLTKDEDVLRLDPIEFAKAPKISLDYAVMEKTSRAAVIDAPFTWSDLGAWDAIWAASAQDAAGNAVTGDAVVLEASGCIVRSDGPMVGVIGVSDLVVVAEGGSVLVCRREDAQQVKALTEKVKAHRAGR